MDEKSYIPIYRNWLELMETKDTEEKQLAFLKGIFDAFAGIEPPRPRDMENPRGADYARRDGYLVAIPVAERPATRADAGRLGGMACGGRKADTARENGRMGGRPKKVVDTVVNTENPSKNPSGNQSKKTQALRIEKEKEYKNIIYPRSGDAQKTHGGADLETPKNLFDEFWGAYPGPRKVDKKKCRAKYDAIMKKAHDAGTLHVAVMAGLAAWKRSRMWTEDGGRFVKAPLTWLNGECWNDAPASDPADAEAARKDREAEAERRIVEELRSKGLMA